MDTETLTESLRALDAESFTWKFALYSAHNSRDGMELEWNLCAMQGIAAQVDRLKEHLLKKTVEDKPVTAYTPFLSHKENIGALNQDDEMIHDQISDILLNIQNGQTYPPEDFVSGAMPRTVGFAFYGECAVDDEGQPPKQALFMRRGNPFHLSGSAGLYTSDSGQVVAFDKPILKFPLSVDFLLVGGLCYFLSAAIKKDFDLEERHFAIAQKCMGQIAGAEIASDYEHLEQCAMKAGNARKFLDFDKKIMERIARLSIVDREEFLSTYGVTIDNNGLMDTSDPEQCELVVDLLCCRSCLDPLGRLSVGKNITPREY